MGNANLAKLDGAPDDRHPPNLWRIPAAHVRPPHAPGNIGTGQAPAHKHSQAWGELRHFGGKLLRKSKLPNRTALMTDCLDLILLDQLQQMTHLKQDDCVILHGIVCKAHRIDFGQRRHGKRRKSLALSNEGRREQVLALDDAFDNNRVAHQQHLLAQKSARSVNESIQD